jgi:hypothetical protein
MLLISTAKHACFWQIAGVALKPFRRMLAAYAKSI